MMTEILIREARVRAAARRGIRDRARRWRVRRMIQGRAVRVGRAAPVVPVTAQAGQAIVPAIREIVAGRSRRRFRWEIKAAPEGCRRRRFMG